MNFFYHENERVLCFHGPLMYEAKVLKYITKRHPDRSDGEIPLYFVHYKGWKSKWDEWVPENRIKKYTEENLREQHTLRKHHLELERKKADAKRVSNSFDQQNEKPPKKKTSEPTENNGGKSSFPTSRDNNNQNSYNSLPSLFDLSFGDDLVEILNDDYEEIVKNKKILDLPLEHSVDCILTDYRSYMENEKSEDYSPLIIRDNDVIDEFIHGISSYFNQIIGFLLLYRFERQQYSDFYHQQEGPPSSAYGFVHLLRLFVKLPQIMSQNIYSTNSIEQLRNILNEFLTFMSFNKDKYYSLTDYVTAPPQYKSLAKGM